MHLEYRDAKWPNLAINSTIVFSAMNGNPIVTAIATFKLCTSHSIHLNYTDTET